MQRRSSRTPSCSRSTSPATQLQRFVVDNDPYVFRGRMGGHAGPTRAPPGVTNVSAGATFTPAFLLGPK